MKKLLTLGVASLAVAGVVGIGNMSVSAFNGRANGATTQAGGNGGSLESRAAVLNMSTEELQTALQTKTMSQIAVEQGLDEEAFRTKMTEAAQARWEARGLSEEEIAKRIADRESRQAANSADHEFGSGKGDRMGGYGRNR